MEKKKKNRKQEINEIMMCCNLSMNHNGYTDIRNRKPIENF